MSFSQTYNPHIKANPGFYRDIWMDATTEKKTAQALDNFGIRWEYHPHEPGRMLSNGLWYSPDFWLPELKLYIECKSKPNPENMGKAHGLVYDTEHPVIIMGYDWVKFFKYFFDVTPSEKDEKTGFDPDICCYSEGVYLAHCPSCGKYCFVAMEDTYTCSCCGYYDGDELLRHADEISGINDFFRIGQAHAASKYEKYCNY